jgi:hypothetical protein
VERTRLAGEDLVPGGGLELRAAVDQEPRRRRTVEEGGEVERSEAVRRPRRDERGVAVEQGAELFGLTDGRRLEDVELGLRPLQRGGHLLLASVERLHERRDPLRVARVRQLGLLPQRRERPLALVVLDGRE